MEVSRAVGDRRLLKLAERLDAVPRKQFNYSVWVGDDWGGALDLSCGTTACALGWATTIPSFRRQGLRFRSGVAPMNVEVEIRRNGKLVSDESFKSGELFFGLTYDESLYLFAAADIGEVDATAKQVARKIRRFVETRAVPGEARP